MKLTVPDMTCGHCVATVTRAIKALDPDADVKADLEKKTVSIETALPGAVVSKALEDEGYPSSET